MLPRLQSRITDCIQEQLEQLAMIDQYLSDEWKTYMSELVPYIIQYGRSHEQIVPLVIQGLIDRGIVKENEMERYTERFLSVGFTQNYFYGPNSITDWVAEFLISSTDDTVHNTSFNELVETYTRDKIREIINHWDREFLDGILHILEGARRMGLNEEA